jgi:DNA polymerase I-like protein with 3'-5' exonuclease and polymerase domains
MTKKQIGLDIETIGTDVIGGLVWSVALLMPNRKVKIEHDCMGLHMISNEFADLIEDERVEKIIHNGAFDDPYMFHNLSRKNGKRINLQGFIWDSDLAEQVIQGVVIDRKYEDDDPFYMQYGTRLDLLMKRYKLNMKMTKGLVYRFIDRPKGQPFDKDEIAYMIGDIDKLDKLRFMQEKILQRDEQMETALLEMEFLRSVAIPQKRIGIGFDLPFWMDEADRNEKEYNKRLKALPKQVENWGSEKQIKTFFRARGIAIDSLSNLEDIYKSTSDPILKKLIEARELHSSVTKYGKSWEEYVDSDGRVRPRVRQIISTGRNSYSDPPLHGLPKEGQQRRAIVPAHGNILVGADFSGQEIGIMAAMAKEKIWIDALLRGEDVHSLTAYIIDKGSWEAAASKGCTFPKKCKCPGHIKLRDPAKINNFMLAYGGGPKKLMLVTGMDWITAKIFVTKHKKAIPKLTAELEKNAKLAVNTGETYSADPYRRRRVLVGSEQWHIENQGKNSPIQMAGANMMKLAAISVPRKYYICLIIHDEIWLEVPKKEAKQAAKVLKTVMEQAADYVTGIKGLIRVEPKIAMNVMKGD